MINEDIGCSCPVSFLDKKSHDCSRHPRRRTCLTGWPTGRLKETFLKQHPSFKRVPQDDRVVAFGAGGNKVNARLGEFLELLQILLRVDRQLVKAPYTQRGFLPARQFLVDRLALRQRIGAARRRRAQLAFIAVSGAYADDIEPVEHVELGY